MVPLMVLRMVPLMVAAAVKGDPGEEREREQGWYGERKRADKDPNTVPNRFEEIHDPLTHSLLFYFVGPFFFLRTRNGIHIL